MNANSTKPVKRPFGADRPFPWRCRHCGQQQVYMSVVSYDAEACLDGRIHAFNVPKLETPACRSCKELVITERTDEQITAALRSHLNLLTPEEMRAGLERVGMTANAAAESLGIAEATLVRWLEEFEIQPRAMDNLLRVFLGFPEVRSALKAHDPSLGIADTNPRAETSA
jgi:hypothetical protein